MDGGFVDVAHEFADVLQLAAARTVSGDFLGVTDGCVQRLRQVHPLELAGREFNQFGTQVAQGVHGGFLLGF